MKLNYFRFQDTLYLQEEGLAMGTPTLSIFFEIYLQHDENKKEKAALHYWIYCDFDWTTFYLVLS